MNTIRREVLNALDTEYMKRCEIRDRASRVFWAMADSTLVCKEGNVVENRLNEVNMKHLEMCSRILGSAVNKLEAWKSYCEIVVYGGVKFEQLGGEK